MNEKSVLKTNSAIDYMGYALYAFGGLGIEILLMMIETSIYGHSSNTWSTTEHILHWTITSFIWAGLGIMLVKQLPAIQKKKSKEIILFYHL